MDITLDLSYSIFQRVSVPDYADNERQKANHRPTYLRDKRN